jgi:hypothetical protein
MTHAVADSPCIQDLGLAVDACSDLAITNQALQLLHQRPAAAAAAAANMGHTDVWKMS